MADQELDLHAHMLREELSRITSAPEDKSLNQVKQEAMIRHFEEVEQIAKFKALHEDIHAIGKTPQECVHAAAQAKGWGEIAKIRELEESDSESSQYTWGLRFTAGGTSMKAAGWEVPGGFVMTWWK